MLRAERIIGPEIKARRDHRRHELGDPPVPQLVEVSVVFEPDFRGIVPEDGLVVEDVQRVRHALLIEGAQLARR